jgi:hypothetical protein
MNSPFGTNSDKINENYLTRVGRFQNILCNNLGIFNLAPSSEKLAI